MELTVGLSLGEAASGWTAIREASLGADRNAKLTFGRGEDCDLTIPVQHESFLQFSRMHGHFYHDFPHWRVRLDGSSELRMWLDFGIEGVVTCHGPGSDVRLPVNQGRIAFRPAGTSRDVQLRWTYPAVPTGPTGPVGPGLPAGPAGPGVPAVLANDRTTKPSALLHLPPDLLTSRFVVFLLVLCHRLLLRLDYTAPTVDQLALWMSPRRGEPISTETVRTEYVGKLRTYLQNTAGSRTFVHREGTRSTRQHAELAMLAQDVVDSHRVTCDELVECIRSGRTPNFPDLGWKAGRRG